MRMGIMRLGKAEWGMDQAWEEQDKDREEASSISCFQTYSYLVLDQQFKCIHHKLADQVNPSQNQIFWVGGNKLDLPSLVSSSCTFNWLELRGDGKAMYAWQQASLPWINRSPGSPLFMTATHNRIQCIPNPICSRLFLEVHTRKVTNLNHNSLLNKTSRLISLSDTAGANLCELVCRQAVRSAVCLQQLSTVHPFLLFTLLSCSMTAGTIIVYPNRFF